MIFEGTDDNRFPYPSNRTIAIEVRGNVNLIKFTEI